MEFCVSAFLTGIQSFEVTNCDLKQPARMPTLRALRVYRARRGHAFQHIAKQARRNCEHSDHARIWKLREMLATHRELTRNVAELEKRIEGHDEEITAIFEAIRHLMEPPEKPKKRIGFHG